MSAADRSLIDLISSDDTATKSTFALKVDGCDEQCSPAPAQTYNAVFTRYTQFLSDLETVISRQKSFERELFGESFTEDVSTQCITKIAEASIAQLVANAERQFSPSGGTLKIDVYKVLEATGQSGSTEKYREQRWRPSKGQNQNPRLELDLDKIWSYLETTYGGEAGVAAGYRQQADLIVETFRLNDDEASKRSSSHVSCFVRVYSEKNKYGSGNGKYQPGYHYRDKTQHLCKALSCFSEWAELDALAIALLPNRHDLCDYDLYYTPRDKRLFPGLEVVLFKDKWEWKFSHEVAAKLMLFLGEYARQS